MDEPQNDEPEDKGTQRLHRRAVLRRIGGLATIGAAGLAARRAVAGDAALDALIGDTQRGGRQGFDDASRNVQMPRRSLPTVSAATAQTTEQAIDRYAAIVGRGGWPQVTGVSVLRLGDRHPSVSALRARLVALSATSIRMRSATTSRSHVEAAVRRFQLRHGLTVDGVIRAETLGALNVPAPVRLAQLKINLAAVIEYPIQPPLRGLQHSGGAHRGD